MKTIKENLLESSIDKKSFFLLGYAMAIIEDYVKNFPDSEKEKYYYLKNEIQKLIYHEPHQTNKKNQPRFNIDEMPIE